ncbi:putative rRNA methylase [Melghirimyces profundicolus]|uniref:Putative rRNA methylase n=1 Tax=Melghirimyces profundicolus TaxID=1242148 RepID=A0A2T6BVZ3_9BACL|nr:class I SAM-dependent methyltransferase [Melghirimyces profundicolus]PTX60248.1 putative rRNA methylase [Melghirimyces profundicolus]
MSLPATLPFAHQLVKGVLPPGGWAVDATVGNGHDTLFLARSVGAGGKVHGFDIQREALERAEARLRDNGVAHRVTLHHQGHHRMKEYLPPEWKGKVSAVMFNLGYLPKGDPTVITRPATTLPALSQALEWLSPGGILTAVLYTRHPGGAEEADRVLRYIHELDPRAYRAVQYRFLNRRHAPSLIAVFKPGG